MSINIAIVDFQMGNLNSVQRACTSVGLIAKIVNEKQEILDADGVIIPGVGAFGDAMINLERLDLINTIREIIDQGKPVMGICLGMQLLMSNSEEFGWHKGLDLFPGAVVRFPATGDNNRKIKVPQVGWSEIYPPLSDQEDFGEDSFLKGIQRGEYMYFVHSYYAQPEQSELIIAASRYEGIKYCSAIQWKNVFATQFHPEKSGREGLKIYQNWAHQNWDIDKTI